MQKNKIFCLGDGYAHGHIWPEWPQILQVLCPSYEVTIISAIGAGHEFLINELLHANIQDSLVIFQWPLYNRFDKLIQDDKWKTIVKLDQVYHFNTYQSVNGTWWCSSASQADEIKQYHNIYVQDRQSRLRQHNQQILIEAYTKQHNARYISTSNGDQEKFVEQSKLTQERGTEIQPSPLIHYHWLMQKIIPLSGLSIDRDISNTLLQRIISHTWVSYDPDREEIWKLMSTTF